MDLKDLTVFLAGAGLGGGAAAALAGAGAWRNASYDELALFEAIGGGGIVLYACLRGARDRQWRRREASWTRVEATITASGVARAYPWGGGSTDFYKPDVRYRFTLDGVEHEGTRVQIDAGSNTSRSDVQDWVDRYPVGAAVLAYCDPKNPKLSVLELDDDGGGLLVMGLGALPVFALFAGVFAVLGRQG